MCANRSFHYFFLFLLFSFRFFSCYLFQSVWLLNSHIEDLVYTIYYNIGTYTCWDLASGAPQKQKKAKLKSIERQCERERKQIKIFKCRMQQRFNFWVLLMKIYYCRNMSIYFELPFSFLVDRRSALKKTKLSTWNNPKTKRQRQWCFFTNFNFFTDLCWLECPTFCMNIFLYFFNI